MYTPVLLKTKGRLDGETFNLSFHQLPKINPEPELRRRSRTGLSRTCLRPAAPPGNAAAANLKELPPRSRSVRAVHAQGWVTSPLASCQHFIFQMLQPGTRSSQAEHGAGEDAILRGKVLFNWRRASTGEQNYPEMALTMKNGLWSRLDDFSNVLSLVSVSHAQKCFVDLQLII